MNSLHKVIFTLHRILGTLLSCVFLMWFLTGIVMVYHGNFPRPDRSGNSGKTELLSATPDTFPALDSVLCGQKYSSLTLDRYLGHTVFHVTEPDTVLNLTPSGQADEVTVDAARLDQVVKLWCQSPIEKVDTLQDLDQWVPFSSHYKQLPILKYYFQDDDQHQLYIGSHTGDVLQFTSRTDRFWCWIGSIPHWVYFSWLRTDAKLWSDVIIWIAGFCVFMAFTGLWCGVVVWNRTRKQNKFSPYKKKWYHWHYILGFIFGIFCMTYAFSGLMSLADVPGWISKPSKDFSPQMELMMQQPDSCTLDYRKVLAAYPQATRLEWNHVGKHPYYTVTLKEEGAEPILIDGLAAQVTPFQIDEKEATSLIKGLYEAHQMSTKDFKVTKLTEPELYYRARGNKANALPAWKIETNDADKGVFYINPKTARVQYVDTTSRWGYWMYQGLHTLKIPGIMEHEWLRQLLQWLLMLGGASVSITGVVLGIRYIIRLIRKL